MWLLALLLAPSAHALTEPRSGVSIDLAAGGGLHAPPALGDVVGFGSLGWWAGTYDDSYAIGRYWSVHVNGRVDIPPKATVRIAPQLEVRRGLDLVVAGWFFGVNGGPLIVGESLGAGGRALFGAEFRRTRYWGLTLRLEAGVDSLGGEFAGAGSAVLGVQFSRPADGKGVK